MKKIHFLPIDNRPITYSLTKEISKLHKSLDVRLPKKSLMGGLYKISDRNSIFEWLKNIEKTDLIVLSLDTLIYGGLVSSRRSNETIDEIKVRLFELNKILKEKKRNNKNLKVYATSSIMRISNNNINEEEKEYWNKWGKEIYSFSYDFHKAKVKKLKKEKPHNIPKEILNDYLDTRKRNFEVNKIYLDFVENKVFDFFIFSKDDTGEYGLNVLEAEFLEGEIKKRKLNAIVKTGADEIPLGLLLRGVIEDYPIKIKVEYLNKKSTNLISRYEDISVENCVLSQIKIGAKNSIIEDVNPDIILYVNNFTDKQGDLVFRDLINSSNEFKKFDLPYIIADINNANGADRGLIENILKEGYNKNFLGYSGYNTSANTIGSSLAIGLISYIAKKENRFDEKNFKKLLSIRLLDDWAYQSDIRNYISGNFNYKKLFLPYEKRVNEFLYTNYDFKYNLPWKRSFEVEIKVKENKNGNKI